MSKQLQWVTDHLQIVNDRFVLCVHCHRKGGKKRDGESGQQIFMAAATVNAVVVVVVLKVIRRSTKVSRVLLSWASCL